MARRSKKSSLLEIAIAGSWVVSAIFTITLLIVIFIVIPSVTNPILKPIFAGLRTVGLYLMAIFGLMACIKFVLQSKQTKQVNITAPPTEFRENFKTVSNPTVDTPKPSTKIKPTIWSLSLIHHKQKSPAISHWAFLK